MAFTNFSENQLTTVCQEYGKVWVGGGGLATIWGAGAPARKRHCYRQTAERQRKDDGVDNVQLAYRRGRLGGKCRR